MSQVQSVAERVELDKKDKAELQAIVEALGGRATSRTKKAEMIDMILELSGVTSTGADAQTPTEASAVSSSEPATPAPDSGDTVVVAATLPYEEGQPEATEPSPDQSSDDSPTADKSTATREDSTPDSSGATAAKRRRGRRNDEPPAEWELEVADTGSSGSNSPGDKRDGSPGERSARNDKAARSDKQGRGDRNDGGRRSRGSGDKSGSGRGDDAQANAGDRGSGNTKSTDSADDGESGNRRRRRRGRGKERDDNVEPAQQAVVDVLGLLDLREDGYGFVRVNGLLPSKDDVYVPVKMARQFKLRKGDLLTGTARAANRNEKNPALQELLTINGKSPEEVGDRPDFDALTPLFPDERLILERTNQPLDLTPRIIDLITPIGKGQRGMIVSPPKAGKTTILKEITTSIEQNHPEVDLIVLLIDERPEEVTDMDRHLKRGEVIFSTFDRPVEEHCAVAELTLERAKRRVEDGHDVVIVLDGITRLARAYNLSASGTGRMMSGGVDAGALYPPKRFFGAARNLEEGGSLTILATALVETGSRMDEVIFEEFKGTGNMELRLDRELSERMIFPAIDALGSSTRRSELLVLGPEQHSTAKLRKVLAGLADGEDGTAAAGMRLLADRLRTFGTNAEFLAEIAKAP